MRIDIISAVPDLMTSCFGHSILKRAINNKLVEVNLINLRDYSTNKQKPQSSLNRSMQMCLGARKSSQVRMLYLGRLMRSNRLRPRKRNWVSHSFLLPTCLVTLKVCSSFDLVDSHGVSDIRKFLHQLIASRRGFS